MQGDCLLQSTTLTSPVYVSDSGASSIGGKYSVSGLAGSVDVHVFTLPAAQQSHSETTYHPEQRDNSNSPLWPSQPWFPHLLRLCVWTILASFHTAEIHRPTVTTRIHLDGKSYHLHAWRLSCSTRPTKQQDFPRRSLGSLHHL